MSTIRPVIPLFDLRKANKTPYTTYTLIAVNILVFGYTLLLSDSRLYEFVHNWAMIPADIIQTSAKWKFTFHDSSYWNMITTMFLHGDIFHVLGNMWFLFIFGDNVEARMGSFRFLLFYLITGAIAGGVHCLLFPYSPIPVIGASGAISGVLGAYMMFFPMAWVMVFLPPFFLFPVPAFIFIGLWMIMQLLLASTPDAATAGVAWWAHVGGAFAGIILAGLFARAVKEKDKGSSKEGSSKDR